MLFGTLTNALALMPSLYMLEVYGRVVSSRSHMTLGMLTLLVIAAYVWMEVLEWVRETLLQNMASRLEAKVALRVFETIFKSYLRRTRGGPSSNLSDVATMRTFLSSPGMIALLDAPFAIVVILILFAINPWLGLASLLSAVVLAVMGIYTDRGTRQPLQDAHRQFSQAQQYATQTLRQAQVIRAMGMSGSVQQQWQEKQAAFLVGQARASDRAGWGAAGSKFIQTLQGSMLLGLGCWLTLNGSLDPSGSMMIMGSILGGRALSPITQLIGQWRQIAQARSAYERLDEFLGPRQPETLPMPLPAPKGVLQGAGLVLTAPDTQVQLLRGVQFQWMPGQVLAVLGPSGAGKTSLTRLMVGLWPATMGKVRLDGVDIHSWNKAELGPHIGYLPQAIELFEGTLADNIARFGEPDMARLEAAAAAVGLLEHIRQWPKGFDTPVGVDGTHLSGGMRQRVGLARALYGDPQLLILDEPNASLDEAGDASLVQAIVQAKARGATVILVTHRTQILAHVDLLMILRDGQMQAFGLRDEVLNALRQAMTQGRGQAAAGVATGAAS